jgi:hypothetical protein
MRRSAFFFDEQAESVTNTVEINRKMYFIGGGWESPQVKRKLPCLPNNNIFY